MWLVGAGEEFILEVYEPMGGVGVRMLLGLTAPEAVEVKIWMVGVEGKLMSPAPIRDKPLRSTYRPN